MAKAIPQIYKHELLRKWKHCFQNNIILIHIIKILTICINTLCEIQEVIFMLKK